MLLYLTAPTTAVSATLIQVGYDGEQYPMYFISKALAEAETRYSEFEITITILTATQKLQLYFQAHTISVLHTQSREDIVHRAIMPWPPIMRGRCAKACALPVFVRRQKSKVNPLHA